MSNNVALRVLSDRSGALQFYLIMIMVLELGACHFNLLSVIGIERYWSGQDYITQYGSTVYIGMALVWPAL